VRIGRIMLTLRPGLPAHRGGRGRTAPPRRVQRGMCVVALAVTAASVSVAPSAVADSTDTLRAAVLAARGMSCKPLQSKPTVEQTANEVNQSDDKWLDHLTRAVPVEIAAASGAPPDALPLLKDLGYGGSKATVLFGAAKTDTDSIKALLLQGYAKIPDCSYTDYGVSALHNKAKDMIFTTLVLAA
jgi:hypothetical protein